MAGAAHDAPAAEVDRRAAAHAGGAVVPAMRWGWIPLAIVLGAVGIAGSIFFVDPASPTLGDFAEWTYHGVLFRDALAGTPVQGYVLKHYPVPNSLTTVGLAVLMRALPWQVAAKVWLVVELLFYVVAAWWLHRTSGGSRWAVVVSVAGGAFGLAFWAGFSNFLLGCACVMLVAARLLGVQRGGDARGRGVGVLDAGLLLLTFFCHMIPFAFAVLLLAAVAFEQRRPRMLLAAVPGTAMAAWYFVARALNGNADGQAGMVSSVPYLTVSFLLFKVNTFLKCWGLINPALGTQDSLLLAQMGALVQVLLVLFDLGIAVTVGVLLVVRAGQAIREAACDRFFWVASFLFFAVGVVVPGALGGVSDPGGRMMEMVVWCAVPLLGAVGKERGWVFVAGLCALPLLGANLFLLHTTAMRPRQRSEANGPLPAVVRQFAHVLYTDRYHYYEAISSGRMDREIYPTALFLKTPSLR